MVLALDLVVNNIFSFLRQNDSSKFRSSGKLIRFRRSKYVVQNAKKGQLVFSYLRPTTIKWQGDIISFPKVSETYII